MAISDRQAALLRLLSVPGLGPARLRNLLQALGDPGAVLVAADADWAATGMPAAVIRGRRQADEEGLARVADWLARDHRHRLLDEGDPAYPGRLRNLPDPPPLLFLLGDATLLSQPQLAMVGSRHPTAGGEAHARAFSRHLSRCGLIITSGLAQGVDAAAHRGALDAAAPTIAVMGTGPDRVYPAAHRELAHAIVDGGGLLVSEFLPGTGPKREHFPRRNRLISGLSLGTLVVEAGLCSGSLITARLAGEQGREVFAIPGSVHNPLARGCHRLIREGAKLVECADDILEELSHELRGYLRDAPPPPPEPEDGATPAREADPQYRDLLASMGHDPVHVDTLVERSGLTPEAVSSMLLMLELDGQVESLPGGRYARVS